MIAAPPPSQHTWNETQAKTNEQQKTAREDNYRILKPNEK